MNRRLRPDRRYALLLLVMLVALYVLVPQIGSFKTSWSLLRHPDPALLVLALAFTVLTYIAAAATYWLLAFRPLVYAEVLLVQVAAMFINRLLPAGVGALGCNYVFLRHRHHSQVQAVAVVSLNNVLGLAGHVSLLLLTFLATLNNRQVQLGQYFHNDVRNVLLVGVFVALFIVAVLLWKRLRALLLAVLVQLRSYRQRPWRVVGALATSMLLTLSNVLCFLCCCAALNVPITFLSALVIFSFGVGGSVIVPTPGGLGGFEAGLVAGLLALHVSNATALAAALLYRLVSYWLAMLVGAVAFAVAERRAYI